MSAIELSRVSFSFPGSPPIFQDLELRIAPGWTGVVGENGAGKTTLLRLITGTLGPDDGRVVRPSGAVAFCPQEVERCSDKIVRFGVADDGASCRWRGDLQLIPDDLDRWPTLSPGERKRWQIGAALAEAPDVLVLDEPTNHLDRDGVDLLVAALRRFRGLGVLVSHDRNLLDSLPDHIVRLTSGRATTWSGPYSRARCAWEAVRRGEEEEFGRLRDERAALKGRLANHRRDTLAADRNVSAGRRMKGKKDSDARSRSAKGRVTNAAARRSRSASSARP